MFVKQNSTSLRGAGNLSRLEDSVEENNPDPRWIPFENKRSTVWEHIWRNKEDKRIMMCKYCPIKYRSSTSTGSLWRHLNLHHKIPIPGKKDMETWSRRRASHILINDFLHKWNKYFFTFLNSNTDSSDDLTVYFNSCQIYLFTNGCPQSTPHSLVH